MLYLIGLGLNDEGDIPLKAIAVLKRCDEVYAELYTSDWKGDFNKLGKEIGQKIEVLPRERVESDFIIEHATKRSVALLVPGDPLTATTHIDLLARAKKAKIGVQIIHASSIYTAVAECGLQLYKFGRTTTLPRAEKSFAPASPYEIIAENKKEWLHSLILLDTGRSKASAAQQDERPASTSMTVSEGLEILLENEARLKLGIVNKSSRVVACAALGSPHQIIKYGTIDALMNAKIDQTPACLIIPGKLHFTEEEVLELYK